jgi:hypothetical protein
MYTNGELSLLNTNTYGSAGNSDFTKGFLLIQCSMLFPNAYELYYNAWSVAIPRVASYKLFCEDDNCRE